MQQDKKKKREIHMMVAHEGWCRRHPASSEYELMHKSHYLDIDRKDFWEQASRLLCSRYDIDEDTMVVMNGDRASWIRKGVDYFPKATYQFDRFHLKKEINELVKDDNEHTKAIQAINRNDPTGLLAALAVAESKTRDTKKREKIRNLKEDILSIPEAVRDYRARLKETGYDTKGMRGLGAAESNVDRFSNRLKKRGQSWKIEGLKAMVYSLVNRFEGKLKSYAKDIKKIRELVIEDKPITSAGRIARKVIRESIGAKQVRPPALDLGTTSSAGLSKFLRELNDPRAVLG